MNAALFLQMVAVSCFCLAEKKKKKEEVEEKRTWTTQVSCESTMRVSAPGLPAQVNLLSCCPVSSTLQPIRTDSQDFMTNHRPEPTGSDSETGLNLDQSGTKTLN